MRRIVVLGILLAAAPAQACDLAQSPVGPGEVAVTSFSGQRMAFPVHERGLGGDCSIEFPRAIGHGMLAWVDGTTLHRVELATGDHRQDAVPEGIRWLAIDEDGLLALRYHGQSPDQVIRVSAVEEDGTLRPLRDEPGRPSKHLDGHMFVQITATQVVASSVRTGEVLLDAEPSAQSGYSADSLAFLGTDGRFVVYHVTGQGAQITVSWDNDTRAWRTLPTDYWAWQAAVVDGHHYGVQDGRAFDVDLATGEVRTLQPPEDHVLDIVDGWFLSGSYAKQWSTGPFGLPVPGAGILAAAACLGAVALLRRRSG